MGKKADSHASHTFNPVSIPHPQVETFPLLHYFLGTYPNIVAILKICSYTTYAEWELGVKSWAWWPFAVVVSHNVSFVQGIYAVLYPRNDNLKGFFVFSQPWYVGRATTPATYRASRLGVSGCDTAQVGGEDSAYSTQDCRVLLAPKGNS